MLAHKTFLSAGTKWATLINYPANNYLVIQEKLAFFEMKAMQKSAGLKGGGESYR
jgi:hypothetical protein